MRNLHAVAVGKPNRFHAHKSILHPGLDLADDGIAHNAGTPGRVAQDAPHAARVGDQMAIVQWGKTGKKVAGKEGFGFFARFAAPQSGVLELGRKDINARQGHELTAHHLFHSGFGVNAVPVLHRIFDRLPP